MEGNWRVTTLSKVFVFENLLAQNSVAGTRENTLADSFNMTSEGLKKLDQRGRFYLFATRSLPGLRLEVTLGLDELGQGVSHSNR